jgi:hypothetical protein
VPFTALVLKPPKVPLVGAVVIVQVSLPLVAASVIVRLALIGDATPEQALSVVDPEKKRPGGTDAALKLIVPALANVLLNTAAQMKRNVVNCFIIVCLKFIKANVKYYILNNP